MFLLFFLSVCETAKQESWTSHRPDAMQLRGVKFRKISTFKRAGFASLEKPSIKSASLRTYPSLTANSTISQMRQWVSHTTHSPANTPVCEDAADSPKFAQICAPAWRLLLGELG